MARVPCKNCTRRTPGCHGMCSDYNLYKVLSKYEKAKDRDDTVVQSYIMTNVRKNPSQNAEGKVWMHG